MLSLNIKSSNYMCLDIDTDSVIHKHLVKKIDDLDKVIDWRDEGHIHNPVTKYKQDKQIYENKSYQVERHDWVTTKHNLTMLDSFHISLGAPPEGIEPQILPLETYQPGPELAVGYITLSDIKISEKENKKSAWIDVTDLTWRILNQEVETCFVEEGSDQWILAKYQTMALSGKTSTPLDGKWPTWHISLANLTGKPRDSIARPEDCIVDTITS